MTQDEIIEMARQVGLPHWYQTKEVVNIELLEAFAKLVAAKEREACAMIVEKNANRCGVDTVAWMLLASNAQAIRARGEA